MKQKADKKKDLIEDTISEDVQDRTEDVENTENNEETENVDDKENNKDSEKNRPLRRKILRLVLFVIVSFMVGTSVYKINARNLMHDQMPMVFGFSSATVLTGSMEPTLSIDDLIIVKKCDSYDVDDIIVFQEKSSLFEGNACVVHRVVSVNDDGTLTTKGDANDTADDPIELKNIKGKVVFSVPSVGKAVNVIKSPAVVIIVILLSAFLVERSYKSEKKEEKSEIEILQEQIELLKKQKELEELKNAVGKNDSENDDKKDE